MLLLNIDRFVQFVHGIIFIIDLVVGHLTVCV